MGQVATAPWILIDGVDLSGDFTSIADVCANPGDRNTVFGATVHTKTPGLPETDVEFGGFHRAGTTDGPDTIIRPNLGLADKVLTYGYRGSGAEGEVGYFGKIAHGGYQVGAAEPGKVIPFRGSAFLTGPGYPLIRGSVVQNGAETGSTSSAGLQLGAVGSSAYLYACLHVLAISGTLDVVVESDTTGFGSPTTRITFAQATAIGAQLATRIAGPITDDYWRATWTLSGTATFAVVVGIQA